MRTLEQINDAALEGSDDCVIELLPRKVWMTAVYCDGGAPVMYYQIDDARDGTQGIIRDRSEASEFRDSFI